MIKIFTILLVTVCLVSCEKFVELDTPKTQIVNSNVFENDAGTKAALVGIYSQFMTSPSFVSGGLSGITVIAGLSADELNNHETSQNQIAIYNNSLTPVNTTSTLWSDLYSWIYESNSILEGVQNSNGITKPVKDQAIGQALFNRAFGYFYLVNLYGDVPLLTSTDYRMNSSASRTPVAAVYQQIEKDLMDAQDVLLSDYSFSDGEKVAPNRWAATALLARTFLYQGKWGDAETQATAIIDSQLFSLNPDLNTIFLANSDEAIWQLIPVSPGFNTYDGQYFIIVDHPTGVSVADPVLDTFESGDNRATTWIGSYSTDDGPYAYADKYKVHDRDLPLTEYQMVFRLAEQILIRAEARAMQNNLTGAIEDVNMIRLRAGLSSIDAAGLSQEQVLDVIEQERRAELFIEWGHRWFDLKRSGKIDAALTSAKPNWQSNDALFPIAQTEINANPNLVQNP